jgi:TonB family protein
MQRCIVVLLFVASLALAGERFWRDEHGVAVYATYAPKPNCPALPGAHPAQVSGVFLIHITADGRVSAVSAVNSTASSVLDNEAVTAFRKWRFRPPGRPTTVKIPITFVFPR